MNKVAADTMVAMGFMFCLGCGVRDVAYLFNVHRDTAMRYRWRLISQIAYDELWDGNTDTCDELTALLPDRCALKMLDAWCDDWCNDGEKSGWHGENAPMSS